GLAMILDLWSLFDDKSKITGYDSYAAALSTASCSSVSVSSAAAMFSSRCATLDVPGMGNTTGASASSQASATCPGVAPVARGTPSTGPPGSPRSPCAIGAHGMKPMPAVAQ